MNNVVKPVIPAVVADAIEQAKMEELCNENIIEVRNEEYPGGTQVSGAALRLIPFNTLLAALVNGYERELTEEERRADRKRKLAYEFDRHRCGAGNYDTHFADDAFADGIEYALDAVGVKIEGINA